MPTKNPFPWYAPRFWHGMPSRVWWPLLHSHGWRIGASRLHFATSVSVSTAFNDLCGSVQHILHGKRIRNTPLAGPPVFVLGHWRSGTTLLHELLHLDDRFASPNTFQCFAPWHFLVTESGFTRFGNFLLPSKRPMDDMKAGWTLPQEDEFALMSLGAASPYTLIAFPNEKPSIDTLATATFPADQLPRWKELFDWFMRALTYHSNRPLILKSPPHTGRIALLAAMYPDAKFVHIARDPRAMIPSTMKLWSSLCEHQSLQRPSADANAYEDFVFACFERMYAGYFADKSSLSNDRLIEISYESLTQDPEATMSNIYSSLQLGGFDEVRDRIKTRMQSDRDYKVNQWQLPDPLANRIQTSCHQYKDVYGYNSGRGETN
jgi:omega-hydroxy-beta-dihydromenaquinone-9 sulfotransferase